MSDHYRALEEANAEIRRLTVRVRELEEAERQRDAMARAAETIYSAGMEDRPKGAWEQLDGSRDAATAAHRILSAAGACLGNVTPTYGGIPDDGEPKTAEEAEKMLLAAMEERGWTQTFQRRAFNVHTAENPHLIQIHQSQDGLKFASVIEYLTHNNVFYARRYVEPQVSRDCKTLTAALAALDAEVSNG